MQNSLFDNLPYLILPLVGIALTQLYYQLETNEGQPKFRYFRGNTFNEFLFPFFIGDYLLGKQSALSVFFAFDQFLQVSQFFLTRQKLKKIDNIDVSKIQRQEYERRAKIDKVLQGN